MYTISNKLLLAGILFGWAAGLAFAQYDGPYNFGVAPTKEELSRFFAIGPDGHGLPPGKGTYEEGKRVYMAKCVACHGDKLQGVPGAGDTLIGGRGTLATSKALKTVESYWPYATTVFDYVKRAMPFNAPGSLTDDEVYAVTDYILTEAHVIKKTQVMDAKTLPRVEMPNRNGFIPDSRPDVRD